LMAGAIGAHLTKLGIEIVLPDQAQGDGGLLFWMAVITLVASALIVWLRRLEIPIVGCKLAHART